MDHHFRKSSILAAKKKKLWLNAPAMPSITQQSFLYVKLHHPIHQGVIAYPIQNHRIQSIPKLKLTSASFSLLDLPTDVLLYLFEYLDWKSILVIEQVNHYLRHSLRHTEASILLWKRVALLRLQQDPWFPFPMDMRQRNLATFQLWRQVFMDTQYRHRVMQKIWNSLERFASIEVKHNVRAPLTNEQIFLLEKQLQQYFPQRFKALPFDLRSSLCIHDGEADATFGIHTLGSANSHGVLGPSRLLQSQEILVEYETEKHVLDNAVIRDEQNQYVDNEEVVMIPLTSAINHTQLCMDLMSGKIFIRNGFQLLFKSHTLLELFHSLLDMKRKTYPPIPSW